jgi:hypothetical protein
MILKLKKNFPKREMIKAQNMKSFINKIKISIKIYRKTIIIYTFAINKT